MNLKAVDLNYQSIFIGQSVSFNRIITQDDVTCFARLTGDYNPLHMDIEYASKTEYKEQIVHGMLICSFFSTLIGMYLPGKKCLLLNQNINYRKPVKINEKLCIFGEVIQKVDAMHLLVIKSLITNNKKEIMLDGKITVKVRE